jgi:hypothetical protein
MSDKLGAKLSTNFVNYEDWRVGEFSIGRVLTTTTASYPDGSMRLYPFIVPVDMTVNTIACEVVTTPGSAGSVVRLGIYDDVDGVPTNLILDAGTVATQTTGVKSIAISQALSAGIVWCCAVPQGTPGTNPTLRIISISEGHKRYATEVVNQFRYSFSNNTVTGALPGTAGATLGAGLAAIVCLGRSA